MFSCVSWVSHRVASNFEVSELYCARFRIDFIKVSVVKIVVGLVLSAFISSVVFGLGPIGYVCLGLAIESGRLYKKVGYEGGSLGSFLLV